jgi:hypothetical protein
MKQTTETHVNWMAQGRPMIPVGNKLHFLRCLFYSSHGALDFDFSVLGWLAIAALGLPAYRCFLEKMSCHFSSPCFHFGNDRLCASSSYPVKTEFHQIPSIDVIPWNSMEFHGIFHQPPFHMENSVEFPWNSMEKYNEKKPVKCF